MATSKRQPARRKPKASSITKPELINWIGAGLLVVGGAALFKLGLIGVTCANLLRMVGGNTYQLLAGGLMVLGGFMLGAGRLPRLKWRPVVGSALIYSGALGLLSAWASQKLDVHAHFVTATWHMLQNDLALVTTASNVGGGLVGSALYGVVTPLLSAVGGVLAMVLTVAGGVLVLAKVSAHQVFGVFGRFGRWVKDTGISFSNQLHQASSGEPRRKKKRERAQAKADEAEEKFTINVAEPLEPTEDEPAVAEPKAVEPSAAVQAQQEPQPEEAAEDEALPPDLEAVNSYQLPNPAILTATPPADQSVEYQTIKQNRKKLKQTLDSFGVDVTVKAATLGPSITQYEIQPAVGVKVAKIVNLADDLALALAAKDIRIEAPIPGKPLIGIEVPNAQIAMVGYKDVLAQAKPIAGKPLVVPLGKDVNGQVVTFDLTKMPHLLIAGATGSGKSVMINVIITSILMRTKPSEVRLMLIDPKRVELSVYNGVPHLLTPVVTEARKAPSALNKVLAEMERRYEQFATHGVRNMTEFNHKAKSDPDAGLTVMPYIVVIVDELSDLMMVAGNEVETAIVRLAQMARAAGIHIIIATQRPSVDVITGLIKANIPSRIAFAVSSGVDSRTILDTNGAEKLLGRGDMLYQPIDASKPTRIQGAYIPSEDVEAVVGAITEQVQPAYDERMAPSELEATETGQDAEDELFDEAKQFVIQEQKASTSQLQRHFRIGYNRAARLIDELEQRGYVGPSDGSKPRKVLAAPPEQP